MSAYFHMNFHHYAASTTANLISHTHHGGRPRRQARLSVSQNSYRQFRGDKSMRELTETATLSAFRNKFEMCRSFDLEDDLEFCPSLLSESDMISIHSSSSEWASLASNSPDSSPTQQSIQVASFALNSNTPAFVPPTYLLHQPTLNLHQPVATRTLNAIPIINPATGTSMSSPPPSVSPVRMQPHLRRW